MEERVECGREYVDVRWLNGTVKIRHKLNCEILEKELRNKKE
jgi:hypothetical protein